MDYMNDEGYMDFSFLGDSIGKSVQVERGGPDKITGKLLAIQGDFLAIHGNEGIVYVNANHVKTISESIGTDSNEGEEEYCEPPTPLVDAEHLHDLCHKLKHRLVRINHGGPNALQGVLIEIRPDVITILHQMKDYVHYPLYHVKSITWIVSQDNNKKDDNKSDNKSDGKSDGGKRR